MKRKTNLAVKKTGGLPTQEKLDFLVKVLLDRKAEEIIVLDLREMGTLAEYFVICSARSVRHVQGIAEHLLEELERQGIFYRGVEGLQEGQWVLIDCDEILIHIFYAPVRAHYDLEGLWGEAPARKIEGASSSRSCGGQQEDS
ncbi:ribosome silencing factor [Thermosulfuriphilus sp.]